MKMGSGMRHLVCVMVYLSLMLCVVNGDNVVFEVHHKYGGRGKGNARLGDLVAHDSHRHGRMLSAVDFQLGGDGSPTNAALYYTQIKIGTPPVEYHVQVDTGSDILWVNCKNCEKCPTKSTLNIPLKQYDLSASSTGKHVTCDQQFCESVFTGSSSSCTSGNNCKYTITYGDGSKTEGYFIRDEFKLDQVTGNLQTSAMNGSIAFGCSSRQFGDLGQSPQAVDGIIGFGQANTSILSQLALSGKVKKVFSHCLDGNKGGGIFTVGEIVEPKINRTPLVPDMPHYNVILRSIEVGDQSLDLPFDLFDLGSSRATVIDSGTTLAYLPPDLYQQLMTKMTAQQANLQIHAVEGTFKCFWYKENINDGFPAVKFTFKGGLSLQVYPNEYLFEVHENEYCIGWQTSKMKSRDGTEITILGDIALRDKLVVYDLNNMTIGWALHNCSSSVKVKDEASGNAYDVGAHDISTHSSLAYRVNVIPFVLFIAAFIHLIK